MLYAGLRRRGPLAASETRWSAGESAVTGWALVFIAVCVLGWALVEQRLATTAITGPMVFVALGLAAGSDGLGIIQLDSSRGAGTVDLLLKATLVLVLFTGAAALHPSSWRKDAALPGRLLGIGLPLTIFAGWLISLVLFSDLSAWEAAIIGAIIAPTDAALGEAVISNPRVPERLRTALDVESGLNDGVSLPFLLIFVALEEESLGDHAIATTFLRSIGVALICGAAVGLVGGWLLVWASRRNWMGTRWSRIAVVAIAVIAYASADKLGGSGFIACFVGGLAYGEITRGRLKGTEALAAELGEVLIQASFLIIGAVLLGPAIGRATWQVVLMAVLALTVVRAGPVALSMIGSGLRRPTVAYLGWFGPRGLATIVFAVLVVREADVPGAGLIVTVATITVALSVYAHGLTANIGARRYADWYAAQKHRPALVEERPLAQATRLDRAARGPGGS